MRSLADGPAFIDHEKGAVNPDMYCPYGGPIAMHIISSFDNRLDLSSVYTYPHSGIIHIFIIGSSKENSPLENAFNWFNKLHICILPTSPTVWPLSLQFIKRNDTPAAVEAGCRSNSTAAHGHNDHHPRPQAAGNMHAICITHTVWPTSFQKERNASRVYYCPLADKCMVLHGQESVAHLATIKWSRILTTSR